MLLIPAIDLKDGHCVRLRQGRMDDATLFSDNPLATARRWISAGAERLHLVDLNGAFTGAPVNGAAIRDIVRTYPDVQIQVGGGIRDEATIATYLDAGVRYVIIGTQAVKNPEFVTNACRTFPDQIIVGIDAKDGLVAIDGWATLTAHRVIDLAQCLEQDGVAAIIYTDIGRDGMLAGPNIKATNELASAINIPVLVSGGITTVDDIRAIMAVANPNIIGAITGRAIYEGTLDFTEGQLVALGITDIPT